MVERLIRPQSEVEALYRKTGVVVFILNNSGQLLLLQESGKHDTNKSDGGEFGTYCETTDPGENWQATLIRGLGEELGVTADCLPRFRIAPSGIVGESLFSSDVLARVAIIHWEGKPDDAIALKGDGEVSVVGWVTPEVMLERQLRPGVRKILLECLRGEYFTQQMNLPQEAFQPLSALSEMQASSNRLSSENLR